MNFGCGAGNLAPAWEQEEQGELERRNPVSTSKPGF